MSWENTLREVKRNVLNVSNPSYSYGNMAKAPFDVGERLQQNEQQRSADTQQLLSQLEKDAEIHFDQLLDESLLQHPEAISHKIVDTGPFYEKYRGVSPQILSAELTALYNKKVEVNTGDSSFSITFITDPFQKYILPNDANDKTSDLQVLGSNAVANEDPTAGEDAKLERTTGEKDKTKELGVGSPAEDGPLTVKNLRKQMEDLFKAPIDPAHDLKDDRTFHSATHLKDLEGTLKRLRVAFKEQNWDIVETLLEALEMYTEAAQRKYDDVKVTKPDIENTSLGEAIGLERPKIT
jgi:hypothetical protein